MDSCAFQGRSLFTHDAFPIRPGKDGTTMMWFWRNLNLQVSRGRMLLSKKRRPCQSNNTVCMRQSNTKSIVRRDMDKNAPPIPTARSASPRQRSASSSTTEIILQTHPSPPNRRTRRARGVRTAHAGQVRDAARDLTLPFYTFCLCNVHMPADSLDDRCGSCACLLSPELRGHQVQGCEPA